MVKAFQRQKGPWRALVKTFTLVMKSLGLSDQKQCPLDHSA